MKKVFLFFASAIAAAGLCISCTDLSGIEERIDTLEEKMASMINSVMALNENVKALQAFSQSGQTVKEIRQEGMKNIGPAIKEMAANEHLDAHKNAVTVRLKTI